MAYLQLTQQPIDCGLKGCSEAGRQLFVNFVDELNASLLVKGQDRIWYQPDNSNFPYRYFWMYNYNSQKRDFITRLNFASNHAFQIQFSHFGARKPIETEFLSKEIYRYLEYKGFPPHVLVNSLEKCRLFVPFISDHFLRIHNHINSKGKLAQRGYSQIEVALGEYLKINDMGEWVRWEKPNCIGNRQIDLALLEKKIAIEVQGTYWHKREGQSERDEDKKNILLQNGWRVVWVWENAIANGRFDRVLPAIELARNGQKFVEVKK